LADNVLERLGTCTTPEIPDEDKDTIARGINFSDTTVSNIPIGAPTTFFNPDNSLCKNLASASNLK